MDQPRCNFSAAKLAKTARILYFEEAMTKLPVVALIAVLAALSGCANYNIGSQHDATDNGSYSESTLNSPVTDQNPHPGGDSSYPSAVSDQGREPAPPDKVDGR